LPTSLPLRADQWRQRRLSRGLLRSLTFQRYNIIALQRDQQIDAFQTGPLERNANASSTTAAAGLDSRAAPPETSPDARRGERTACFGECPVYSVSIDAAQGNVTYEGTRAGARLRDLPPIARLPSWCRQTRPSSPVGAFTTDAAPGFAVATRLRRPRQGECVLSRNPSGLSNWNPNSLGFSPITAAETM
jgi:hypothetical protein